MVQIRALEPNIVPIYKKRYVLRVTVLIHIQKYVKAITRPSSQLSADECKTHLCFEFISHAILCILYPYSCKTHKISSKLGFVGLLMKIK